VPSMISLARSLVEGSFRTAPGPEMEEIAYGIIKSFYLSAPAKLAAWPDNQRVIVDYRDLVQRPDETITRIYEQLGLAMSPEFAAAIAEEAAKMRAHKSGHKYSLATTSIAPERMVEELREVFDRHGFDTRSCPSNLAADEPLEVAGHGGVEVGVQALADIYRTERHVEPAFEQQGRHHD
jgi:hypothetical protein